MLNKVFSDGISCCRAKTRIERSKALNWEEVW